MTWIKCSDRLPEEGKPVLAYDNFLEELRVDYLILIENKEEPYIWAYTLIIEYDHITHWQELPALP